MNDITEGPVYSYFQQQATPDVAMFHATWWQQTFNWLVGARKGVTHCRGPVSGVRSLNDEVPLVVEIDHMILTYCETPVAMVQAWKRAGFDDSGRSMVDIKTYEIRFDPALQRFHIVTYF